MAISEQVAFIQRDPQQFPESEMCVVNLYEDLRKRLEGTVKVVGEIVESTPELWSDEQ